jgi:acetyl esterase
MPLHPEVVSLLALMEAVGAPSPEEQGPVEARAARRALLRPPVEDCFEILDVDAGGVPARLYRAAPGTTRPGLLVWFHGGGWVLGDIDTHDNVCRTLTNRTGHTLLSVDYRLAPEDPFPTGLDDCVRATTWACENTAVLGVDAERIAVGGDSAGGNLAAVVCNLLADSSSIRFQLLVYPVTDARAGTPSYTENAEGYFLTASGMQWFIDQYLTGGTGSRDDPRVSPICAPSTSLAGLPPALVITAGFDPLRDEGVSYADRLAEAGVVTTHVHFPGQIHGFFSMPEFLSDARVAHAIAAEALLTALR